MSTTERTTERPIGLRRRGDLVVVPQRFGAERYWVVKDPLTLRYVRLREAEFALMEALDGRCTLHDLQVLFETRFAPKRIQLAEIQRFIAMLHHSGLLLSERHGQGEVLQQRGDRRRARELRGRLLNPLAIRIPGIDPTRLLNVLYPLVRPLFSRTALMLSFLFMASALLLTAMQWRAVSARLPTFNEFFTPSNLLLLGVVTGGIKVLHEFGHALACRHFGGETRDMGLMFLIFAPCLYCDVTDSWRFPNKWHRAAVGAAGIFVEMNLAAAAAYVWWFSEPGTLQQIALGVMAVASVGTFFLNGNPLMRYDGYFILADLIETPNLGERSSAVLRAYLSKWFLGIESDPNLLAPPNRRGVYAAYAAASAVYRWMVTLSIILFMVAAARPYRLENAARLLGVFSVAALVLDPLMRLYSYLSSPATRRRVHRGRAAPAAVCLLAVLLGIVFIPLPHRIFGPLELRPFDAVPVYVEVPGRMAELGPRYGEQVSAGTVLARLENRDVDLAIEELSGRCDLQRAELASLRREQFESPTASLSIPRSEKTLESLERQLAGKRHDFARLTMTAPRSGTFFPPEFVTHDRDEENLPPWSGRPLDPINRGCAVDVGLLLGQIGDARQWQALIVVDQQDVEFIRVGDEVDLLLDALPQRRLRSRVEEIALGEMRAAPRRLSHQAGGEVATSSAEAERPVSTSYQVRVRLEDADGDFRLGWRGTARIHVAAVPLGGRVFRSFCRTFHFQL